MKLPLAFALTVSLAFSATPVRAQTLPEDFKMPCQQVVKLGFDKFMDEFSKQTKDDSAAAQTHGYEMYADCKRKDNERRAKVLPATRQQQLVSIRKNLGILETAGWGLKQLESGGGTMWHQFSTASVATREDFYGSLITSLGKPYRSVTARRKANRLLSSTRIRLRKWQKPRVSEYDGLSETEFKSYYNKSWNSAHAALASLLRTSAQLPDSAALNLTQRINSSTSSSLEFDEA